MSSEPGLLERIVAEKEREVAALAASGSHGPAAPAHPVSFRFTDALRRPPGAPLRVIAECKKASPSMGLIREEYDPGSIARTYAECGAAALSVLTDRTFFQGDLSHIAAARAGGLPILRKDFTISPLQIAEAARAGADAVLLIVRILGKTQLSELLQAAREYGLSALVEVHTEDEARTAMDSGAGIIGINHRDLDTLRMDLSLTERVAPDIRSALPDVVLIGESGVENPEGLARVDPHADAVLIGTALMRSADIPATWRSIFAAG